LIWATNFPWISCGPAGEAALVSPDSVSWRVFKNPLSLFIGGVAAVILELAEPRVRTGVWEHATFRTDPIRRLRRTGLAAIVTIYGARGKAEAMIARIRRMHDRVAGLTPAGESYRANDPELLSWVQATAAHGFLQAYHRYVRPLCDLQRDRYYAERILAASLYGARAPTSEAALNRTLPADGVSDSNDSIIQPSTDYNSRERFPSMGRGCLSVDFSPLIRRESGTHVDVKDKIQRDVMTTKMSRI
jgi:uncharacterized protein (DUF2236 family)